LEVKGRSGGTKAVLQYFCCQRQWLCCALLMIHLAIWLTVSRAQEIQTPEDQKVLDAWHKLSDKEAIIVGARNLAALGFAVHNYADVHDGRTPPVAVPNPNVPFEKRLSGLVLLLPYIGQRPRYVSDEDWPLHRQRYGVDQAVVKQIQRVHKKIDLKKAWDDPANEEAAREVLPIFLVPKSAPMRDHYGYAVSHFALVRGFGGVDNGGFDEQGVALSDVVDGTVDTIGFGQIRTQLGPWLAAGSSTSRYVYFRPDEPRFPTLAGPWGQGYLVGLLDASPAFLVTETIPEAELRRFVGRADREPVERAFLYRPLDEQDLEQLMKHLREP